MGDEERQRVVAAIASDSAKVLPPYADVAGLAFEMRTNVATGRLNGHATTSVAMRSSPRVNCALRVFTLDCPPPSAAGRHAT
jgi:hypothetical protein